MTVPLKLAPTPGLSARAQPRPAAGVTIRISSGTGRGRTALSAFDAALVGAGVANYNLVRLSSVIPPHSTIVREGADRQIRGGWGDRLYCVYASQVAAEPGEEAWAGVGWVWRDDESGAGLFVEHEGLREADVVRSIELSLEDLAAARGGGFRSGGMVTTSARCEGDPVCALVVATYETAGWTGAR